MNHYREEFFTEAMITELDPLTRQSWAESKCSPDTPYNPDWDKYAALNEMDLIRLFTVRDEQDALVGYVTFFVSTTLHSKETVQAMHDSLFILKAHRKGHTVEDLLMYCENEFKGEGVSMMIMTVMCHRDFSSSLKSIGYSQTEKTYIKGIR